ncbi:hypothetical protein [Leptolyngbya iicbica]|uniref:Uncharacterized protein n=2 Tax=Cyanophyceae TaxID=3028117 RepID=A0A4Q7EAX4_9CYAN|nr:hypothetical protein [Leptolyngbya sp. LK]RZM79669.1 hypothetical protein DYY88_13275 [Leptolyngbya sp. LK]
MSRLPEFPTPNSDAHHHRESSPRRRWWRFGVIAWVGLAAVGWLGYLAFFGGLPGNYWLAQVYSISLFPLAAVVLTTVLTAPMFGLAFGLLAIGSIHTPWRRRTRQGAKKLLLLLLIEAMAIAALLPSGILVTTLSDRLVILPWHTTYRAIYVSPLDDNYGDLMLVKCGWFGFCRQVYRSYTDVGSADEAYLQFDAEANQIKLHLEGSWVYVRSPGAPACQEGLHSDHADHECDADLN